MEQVVRSQETEVRSQEPEQEVRSQETEVRIPEPLPEKEECAETIGDYQLIQLSPSLPYKGTIPVKEIDAAVLSAMAARKRMSGAELKEMLRAKRRDKRLRERGY